MPDSKACIAAGLKKGTKEYKECVGYKGKYKKAKSNKSIPKGY